MHRNVSEGASPLGCHLSIARGLPDALSVAESLGNSALQLFTHSPAMWRMKPIADAVAFRARRSATGVRWLVVHTMYLLNLASPDDALHERSVLGLIEEVARAGRIGADAVVTHLGAHAGSGRAAGIRRIVQALDRAMASEAFRSAAPMQLLIENAAGSGTSMGASFDEMAEMISRAEDARLGVCLDTCHAFAAGYDLRTGDAADRMVQEVERTFGRARLSLIHLNDSQGGLASRRDRHEHLGAGEIGAAGLRAVLRHPDLRAIPVILETPKARADGSDADPANLARARAWRETPEN